VEIFGNNDQKICNNENIVILANKNSKYVILNRVQHINRDRYFVRHLDLERHL